MRSTFHSLEVARRGLVTQQTALQTVGHNIANANTPGFTRQRVNFVQTEPFPPASMNRPQIPGQMGTGVQAGSIQRVRESFLDIQYRGENNKLGYWSAKAESIFKMEEIMNEPSETGLSKTLDRFWQSLQDLAVNPMNAGARSVVKERGIAVAESFNYLSTSLKSVQKDLKNEIDVTTKQINSLATRINNINRQIADVEPHGYLPNDLYDERDRLVDELSQLVNIKVTSVKSGGSALEIAEGKYTIELVDDRGLPLKPLGTLVDGQNYKVNSLGMKYDEDTNLVNGISIGSFTIEMNQFHSKGTLKGLIESYGYMENGRAKGQYPEMLNKIDTMAFEFVKELNRAHNAGWSISSIEAGEHTAYDFFEKLTTQENAAGLIKLDDAIRSSINNIAASTNNNGLVVDGTFNGFSNGTETLTNIGIEITATDVNGSVQFLYKINNRDTNPASNLLTSDTFASLGNLITDLQSNQGFVMTDPPTNLNLNFSNIKNEEIKSGSKWSFNISETGPVKANLGDGSNAIALAEVKNRLLKIGETSTTIQSYYESVIGSMAVEAQEAKRLAYNSDVLRLSVDQRRQSVSSVSLDEEMSNMIQFQHAYNASARMITATDELLDRIINGMGLVGR